jgi:carbamoyl-phosphate synthase large subunit
VHAFTEAASVRGPLDLDVARTSSGRYEVIRSEPRLPGWVHLFAASGPNLPWVMVRLAMGEALEPQRELPGGPLLVGGAWQAWMARG